MFLKDYEQNRIRNNQLNRIGGYSIRSRSCRQMGRDGILHCIRLIYPDIIR